MSFLEQHILAPSEHRPILVDFWAPWCGPCRMVGPVLDKLAAEPGARFTLVKVNTDEHQDIAAQFRITSIPALKLFDRRKVIAEMVGALPESQLRAWLAKVLPSDEARALAEAKQALATGDRAKAVASLRPVVDGGSGNKEVRALLGLLSYFEDPGRAVELTRDIGEGDPGFDEAHAVSTFDELLHGAKEAPADATGSQREAWRLYGEGLAALQRQDLAAALERFIGSMRLSRKPASDGARRACIAAFKWLGENDPVTLEHRRSFASALY